MKFYATVNLKQVENAEDLVRAFFKEFNSESSIVIKGNEAKVKIIFTEPPMEIIEAMNNCEIIDFSYGDLLLDKEDKTSNQAITEKETSKIVQENSKLFGEKTCDVTTEVRILANKSNSYQEFVKNVADWLELGQRSELFVNIVMAAGRNKSITLVKIVEILTDNGIAYNANDQFWCAKQISNKFKKRGTSVSFMRMVHEIVKYKNFAF